jgi:hypothetical protein
MSFCRTCSTCYFYEQAYECVMVGPTLSTPYGFGALSSGDLPPPPPMTLAEAFIETQTEVLCQILQTQQMAQ